MNPFTRLRLVIGFSFIGFFVAFIAPVAIGEPDPPPPCNGETGPHTGAWTCLQPGTITNHGHLTWTNSIILLGSTLVPPAITGVVIGPGKEQRLIYYDCSWNSYLNHYETNNFNYATNIYFSPAFPTNATTAGTNVYSAYIYFTSPGNVCPYLPVTGSIFVGKVTNTVMSFNPVGGFYDYMHVKACAPVPALSWGFDVANYVPGNAPYDPTEPNGQLGRPGFFIWPGCPEKENGWLKPMTFYRRRVTIETYVGYIGSCDANGVFSGQLVTNTITTIIQAYSYYRNPWDLDQVIVDAQSDNISPSGAANLDNSTDPSHSQDLRVSGAPADYETTTKITFQASDNSSINDMHVAPTGHNNIDGNPLYDWNQEYSPPPTVTATEVIQYFDSGNPTQPSTPGDYNTVQLATRTTRLEDAVSWSDYMNQIDGLLNLAPLTPRTSVTTREGPLYFDYFGLSDAYPDMNILPSGANYDFNTKEYSFNVAPNQLYGIQFGPNETGLPGGDAGSVISTPTFAAADTDGASKGGQVYPYYWHPAPENDYYFNRVSAPEWDNGNAANNGTDIPATCCFDLLSGSVTLHAGKSSEPDWQADKDYAAGEKVSDSNGHTEICTVAGHSSASTQPAWANTLGGVTTDDAVRWQAILTPVTALVSPAHANRLIAFPLKSGSVLACDNTGLDYPAVNSPTYGEFRFGPSGFVKEKSRVRIPNHPESVVTDVANFTWITHSVPTTTNILLNSINQYDLSDVTLNPFSNLLPGEYLFGPGDIQTPTGYGNLQFEGCASSGLPVDIDIDSDNNNGLNAPDRSAGEEQIEDDPTLPGKIVCVNDGDTDGDGIPDFADGFNFDKVSGNSDDNAGTNHLVPIILEVPAGLEVNYAKLNINYSASDPAGISYDSTSKTWNPAGGNMRVWLKNADQSRNTNRANSVVSPGDYIAPGDYTLAQLGFTSSKNIITAFVEGIAPSGSLGDQQISVTLSPPWNGVTSSDAIRVTVLKVNLDINRKNGTTVPQGQEQVNGSVVQIVPDHNPSGLFPLFPNGIFLTIPTLNIEPMALSSYVTLKLKKEIPSSDNTGEIRVYRQGWTDDDYSIFMDKTDVETNLTVDDLSASWKLDSTSGGVVDLALVAEMHVGAATVELGRDTIRISSIPCAPADGRIVFVNPGSASPAEPYDNFTNNAAHSIHSAAANMQPNDNILIARRPGAATYQENGILLPNFGVIAGLAGKWTAPDPSTTPYPESDAFDFSSLPVIDGTGSGTSIFRANGITLGSQLAFGGLKFFNGNAGLVNSVSGGGALHLENLVGIPACIVCCNFDSNLANDFGGAVYLSSVPNASLTYSKFDSNKAVKITDDIDFAHGMGGAIACISSTLSIGNCSFNKDIAEVIRGTYDAPEHPQVGSAGGGGDIYTKNGSLIMTNSRSTSAVAGCLLAPGNLYPDFFTGDGGAILVHGTTDETSIEIRNSLFDRPTSFGNGGAISLSYDSSANGRAYFHGPTLYPPAFSSEPQELGGICNGTIANVIFSQCHGGWQGGAISIEGRGMQITVDTCVFSSCLAGTSHFLDGKGGAMAVGGGIQLFAWSPQDNVIVKNTSISDCSASGNGGGLYTTIRGKLTLQDSSIDSCVAQNQLNAPQTEGMGGAIHASAGGVLELFGLNTIEDNHAATSGGGISIKSAQVDFYDNIIVQRSQANGDAPGGFGNGGGLFVTTSYYDDVLTAGPGWGAAMAYLQDGTAMSYTPTLLIKDNSASRYGGGLYAWQAPIY